MRQTHQIWHLEDNTRLHVLHVCGVCVCCVDQLAGKRVLMRVDFNVPIKDGAVTDKTRIVATLPTINFAFEKGAKALILMSHCGRPDGRKQNKYTLKPVVPVSQSVSESLSECILVLVVSAW